MDRKQEILKTELEKFYVEHSENHIDDYTRAYDAIYEAMETYAKERVIEEMERQLNKVEAGTAASKTEALAYSGVALLLLTRINQLKQQP